MKILILTLVLTFIVVTPRAHALFGHVANERDRRQDAEQRLVTEESQRLNQQTISGRWQLTSFVLGIGCVGCLVVGAGIGSKGRKDAR